MESLDKDFLVECTQRIEKRLGPEQSRYAIAAIRENNMEEFVRRALVYYDKAYLKGLGFRKSNEMTTVPISNEDPLTNASDLLRYSKIPIGSLTI